MERPALTPAMRRTALIVGAVVAAGLLVALWLTFSPGERDVEDAAGTLEAAAPTQGPIPGATPTTGSEVLPPEESGGIRLPSIAPAAPLIPGPFPAAGSSEGDLVEGFPGEVMGPMPDSEVLNSSIAAEGATMQVSLVARTDAAPEEVEAHYAALWGAKGLIAAPRASAEDPLTYVGPYESLTLSFSPTSGTGTVYAVFGVFRAS